MEGRDMNHSMRVGRVKGQEMKEEAKRKGERKRKTKQK